MDVNIPGLIGNGGSFLMLMRRAIILPSIAIFLEQCKQTSRYHVPRPGRVCLAVVLVELVSARRLPISTWSPTNHCTVALLRTMSVPHVRYRANMHLAT